jgi:hypothetical protein
MACDDDVIPLQERIAMLYDPAGVGTPQRNSALPSDDAPPSYWRAPPHEHSALFRQAKYGAR